MLSRYPDAFDVPSFEMLTQCYAPPQSGWIREYEPTVCSHSPAHTNTKRITTSKQTPNQQTYKQINQTNNKPKQKQTSKQTINQNKTPQPLRYKQYLNSTLRLNKQEKTHATHMTTHMTTHMPKGESFTCNIVQDENPIFVFNDKGPRHTDADTITSCFCQIVVAYTDTKSKTVLLVCLFFFVFWLFLLFFSLCLK